MDNRCEADEFIDLAYEKEQQEATEGGWIPRPFCESELAVPKR